MPEAPGQYDGQYALFGGESEPPKPEIAEQVPLAHEPDAAQLAFSRLHEAEPTQHAIDIHRSRAESFNMPMIDDSAAWRDQTREVLRDPTTDAQIDKIAREQASAERAINTAKARALINANADVQHSYRLKAEAIALEEGLTLPPSRQELALARHRAAVAKARGVPDPSNDFPLKADTAHDMGHLIEGVQKARTTDSDIEHAS